MRRLAAVVLAGSVIALVAAPALAEPNDAQAEKAIKDALGSDYLETRFDKAEQKLRAAIERCGASGCSAGVKAKLYAALGAVLAGGKKQLEDARDAFVEALKLDKNVRPDPDVASAEVTFAYEKARAELKMGSAGGQGPGGPSGGQEPQGNAVMLPAAQKVNTPIPVYVELAADLSAKASKVTVTYLAPAAQEAKVLYMKKFGERGWAIEIPCAAVGQEGTLAIIITATDESGAILAAAGTREQPLTTEITAQFKGEAPHLPGHAPPEACGPPQAAGPKQCLDDAQCNQGLACVQGTCQPPQHAAPPKFNWASISFSPDLTIVSGNDVCTSAAQQNDHYVCYRSSGSRYVGTPTKGLADNIRTGMQLATMRLMVGYDRVFWDRITLGARVGFAFGGASTEGASFLPVHLEARGAYYLAKRPFEDTGARPYVFASGGLAQVDTKVSVNVLEDGKACGAVNPSDQTSPCTRASRDGVVEPRKQTLSAYKQAGNGFVGVGGGIAFAPLRAVEVDLSLRVSVTLPVVVPVIAPAVGVAFGF